MKDAHTITVPFTVLKRVVYSLETRNGGGVVLTFEWDKMTIETDRMETSPDGLAAEEWVAETISAVKGANGW